MFCVICENVVEAQRKEPHICAGCTREMVAKPSLMKLVRSDKVDAVIARSTDAAVRRLEAIRILQHILRQAAKWAERPCKGPATAWIVIWLRQWSKKSVQEIREGKI